MQRGSRGTAYSIYRECCHECCTRVTGQQSRERLFSLIRHTGINLVINFYQYFINEVTYVEDRGGLIYPTKEFVARLWTIYNFCKQMLPHIHKCSYIKKDLVTFLAPKLEMCATFACDACLQPATKNATICLVLRKFINPLLINHSKMMRDLQPGRAPVTSRKTLNRKYQTFN